MERSCNVDVAKSRNWFPHISSVGHANLEDSLSSQPCWPRSTKTNTDSTDKGRSLSEMLRCSSLLA